MNRTPVLEGHGVRLVPLSVEDLPALECTHDESTWTWMSETGRTSADMRTLVERAIAAADAGTTQAWTSLLLRENDLPLVAGCTRIADIDLHHRRGELGWTWIAPSLRGGGLNVRVKLLQLAHAFDTLQMRRVALKTHHGNVRSQGAMLKLGAHFEGTHRKHMIMPDGSSRDTMWYSILDTEWPAVREALLARIAAEPLLLTGVGLRTLQAKPLQ